MYMHYISQRLAPPEVLEACNPDMPPGVGKRIVHMYKSTGEPCSKDKSAAGNLLRNRDGWFFTCFRCSEGMFIPNERIMKNQGAKSTGKRLTAAQQKELIKENTKTAVVLLPEDFEPITDIDKSENGIPDVALAWLRLYGITTEMCLRYNIGWSPKYARIIFPIRNRHLHLQLAGWQGRCPYALSKKERAESHRPKWLTRKRPDVKRLYYLASRLVGNDKEGSAWRKGCRDPLLCILVEDIISAIKVNTITGYNTIALLTTSSSKELISTLPYTKLVLWLDNDAFQKSIGSANKYSAFGYECRVMNTKDDPKALSPADMAGKLSNVINTFE